MKLFKKEKITIQSLLDKIGNRIYSGPFSGLKIPLKASKILTISEVLGLYESCLHSKFEYLISNGVKDILLVGGNNGYYAAGLSYLFNPNSIKIFETEVYFHSIIESWFIENELCNMSILGKATIEEFKKFESNIELIFMDCEGFEIELLDPLIFPWQQKAEILLEIHPFYVKNLIATLADRFRMTHYLEIIYDDFNEDSKIEKVLSGLNLDIKYNKHPNHRWIIENDKKVYTNGIFMFLSKKII
ncbi:MAG: hypothetical protein K9I95_03070 [Flavobacteriaceae bacterium]|nr:hypothetical protein [Flavobacteriaceae bacterium]